MEDNLLIQIFCMILTWSDLHRSLINSMSWPCSIIQNIFESIFSFIIQLTVYTLGLHQNEKMTFYDIKFSIFFDIHRWRQCDFIMKRRFGQVLVDLGINLGLNTKVFACKISVEQPQNEHLFILFTAVFLIFCGSEGHSLTTLWVSDPFHCFNRAQWSVF